MRQDELRATKGQEYIRYDDDQCANFKRIGKALGLSPLVVWAVYAHKHWDAIMAFVKAQEVMSEPIKGRLDDLGNYLHLLAGLIADEEAEAVNKNWVAQGDGGGQM